MTAADATFNRYDPWYVKVAFGLFVTLVVGFLADTAQCPKLHRAIASGATARTSSSHFQPEDIVVFRHAEATALRRACVVLRWEVVGDTVAEACDPASW